MSSRHPSPLVDILRVPWKGFGHERIEIQSPRFGGKLERPEMKKPSQDDSLNDDDNASGSGVVLTLS